MKISQFGKKHTWRTLVAVGVLMTSLSAASLFLANENSTFINGLLHITSTKIVDIGDTTVDKLHYKSDFSSLADLYSHQKAMAKSLEEEGATLLKNDGVLPLSKGAKVTLMGRSSIDPVYGGTGSGSVNASAAKNMKDAFEEDGKLSINPTMYKAYQDWTNANSVKTRLVSKGFFGGTLYVLEAPTSVYTSDVRSSYTSYGDAAIVTLSRIGGEGMDDVTGAYGDGTKYLTLNAEEKAMLKEVKDHFSKIIVLINSSNTLELSFIDEATYGINAALWIGGVGQEGLRGVGDILVGNVAPSGRLIDTYASDSFSAPAMQNFGNYSFSNTADLDAALTAGYGAKQTSVYGNYVVYKEGIYVGYKYYETRYEDCVLNHGNAASNAGVYASSGAWNYASEVVYPFGYGLSYTAFSEKLEKVSESDKSFTVDVTVKNTGNVAGKDVVEVYGQSPYTSYDIANGLEKSAVQLVGFAKTSSLAAGASEKVTITVNKYDLATYDNKASKSYILENGDYYLGIGTDAHDALNNILKAKNASGMVDEFGGTVSGDAAKTYKWSHTNLDTTSFLYSDVTHNKVTNQFDDCDLNYYGDKLVTYLSRNDWSGTYPTSETTLVANAKIIAGLQQKYVASANKDTSSFQVSQDNGLNLASLIGTEYNDEAWTKLIDQLSLEDLLTVVARACKAEVTSVGKPLNYLKDSPQSITGSVTSGGGFYYNAQVGNAMLDTDKPSETPSVAYPSETIVAATWNQELVHDFGVSFGEDGLWCLVHHHYSPGANIHRTPYSGRNFEYYSEDGFLSGTMAENEVRGERSKGMITYIKHFVCNDQETNRSGVSTFVNEQALREVYLRGFEYAFTKGGTNAVMGSFNRIGTTWTGAHKGLMTNLLMKEWGFNGITDTDFALFAHMEAKSGIMAGTTDFAVTSNARSDEINANLLTDADLYSAVRESAHRNLYVIAQSAEMNGYTSTSKVVRILTPYQIALISAVSVFATLTAGCIAIYLMHIYAKKEEN